jgi:osmoprotectant transport system ATP-binding protein
MIELLHLVKQYGATRVVDDVSLTIAKGELLVLVGDSGSGKTTTLKMMNRLEEPTGGTIRIDGQDTREIPGPLLRRRIGYVFQQVGLFPHLTIARNVAVPLELAGWDEPRIGRRIDEVLALMELDPAMGSRSPADLSGGQRQRVGVARALAAEPSVMLLDEPFGALDPLTRDRIQETFGRIRRSLGLTAVFVTHDMGEALALADRIAVFRKGRLVQIGTPAALVRSPADADVEKLLDTPRRHARLFDELLERADA